MQQLAGLKSRALRQSKSRTPIHEISSYTCGKSKKCAEQCTTSSCIPRFTLTLLTPRSLKQIIQSHKRKLTIILSKFHRAYQAFRTKPGRDNKLLGGNLLLIAFSGISNFQVQGLSQLLQSYWILHYTDNSQSRICSCKFFAP